MKKNAIVDKTAETQVKKYLFCVNFYGIIIHMNMGNRFRYFLIPFSNLTKGKREILCSQTLL